MPERVQTIIEEFPLKKIVSLLEDIRNLLAGLPVGGEVGTINIRQKVKQVGENKVSVDTGYDTEVDIPYGTDIVMIAGDTDVRIRFDYHTSDSSFRIKKDVIFYINIRANKLYLRADSSAGNAYLAFFQMV